MMTNDLNSMSVKELRTICEKSNLSGDRINSLINCEKKWLISLAEGCQLEWVSSNIDHDGLLIALKMPIGSFKNLGARAILAELEIGKNRVVDEIANRVTLQYVRDQPSTHIRKDSFTQIVNIFEPKASVCGIYACCGPNSYVATILKYFLKVFYPSCQEVVDLLQNLDNKFDVFAVFVPLLFCPPNDIALAHKVIATVGRSVGAAEAPAYIEKGSSADCFTRLKNTYQGQICCFQGCRTKSFLTNFENEYESILKALQNSQWDDNGFITDSGVLKHFGIDEYSQRILKLEATMNFINWVPSFPEAEITQEFLIFPRVREALTCYQPMAFPFLVFFNHMKTASEMLHVEYFQIKVRDLVWYRFAGLPESLLNQIFDIIREETLAAEKRDISHNFQSLKEDVLQDLKNVLHLRTRKGNINILHILVYLLGDYLLHVLEDPQSQQSSLACLFDPDYNGFSPFMMTIALGLYDRFAKMYSVCDRLGLTRLPAYREKFLHALFGFFLSMNSAHLDECMDLLRKIPMRSEIVPLKFRDRFFWELLVTANEKCVEKCLAVMFESFTPDLIRITLNQRSSIDGDTLLHQLAGTGQDIALKTVLDCATQKLYRTELYDLLSIKNTERLTAIDIAFENGNRLTFLQLLQHLPDGVYSGRYSSCPVEFRDHFFSITELAREHGNKFNKCPVFQLSFFQQDQLTKQTCIYGNHSDREVWSGVVNGEDYIFKVFIRRSKQSFPEWFSQLRSEAAFMMAIDDLRPSTFPRLIGLSVGGDWESRIIFVMERVPGISLEEWIKQSPTLKQRLSVLHDILVNVEHLHACALRHNDLHCGNILINVDFSSSSNKRLVLDDPHVYLIDFGNTRQGKSSHHNLFQQTPPSFTFGVSDGKVGLTKDIRMMIEKIIPCLFSTQEVKTLFPDWSATDTLGPVLDFVRKFLRELP